MSKSHPIHDGALAAYTCELLRKLLHHVNEAENFDSKIIYKDDDFLLTIDNKGDKASIVRLISIAIESIEFLRLLVYPSGKLETRINCDSDDYLLQIFFHSD